MKNKELNAFREVRKKYRKSLTLDGEQFMNFIYENNMDFGLCHYIQAHEKSLRESLIHILNNHKNPYSSFWFPIVNIERITSDFPDSHFDGTITPFDLKHIEYYKRECIIPRIQELTEIINSLEEGL